MNDMKFPLLMWICFKCSHDVNCLKHLEEHDMKCFENWYDFDLKTRRLFMLNTMVEWEEWCDIDGLQVGYDDTLENMICDWIR